MTRITWNGQGGKLDSCEADDDGDTSLADALIEMIEGKIVSPGDTFVVSDDGCPECERSNGPHYTGPCGH